MSAAQLIPMVSPDGTPGHVAANEVDAAVKAGYRRGASVTSPKGESGIVAIDELPAAMKAGYKPMMQASQATTPQEMAAQALQASGVPVGGQVAPIAPKVNMQEQSGALPGAAYNGTAALMNGSGRFLKAFGEDAVGQVKGNLGLARDVMAEGNGTLDGMSMALARHLVSPIVQSANDPNQSKAETLGQLAGVNSQGVKEAALKGDMASILGHSVLPLATAMVAGRGAKEVAPDVSLPSTARAGENFSAAMAQAGDKPVSVTSAMEPVARMQELSDAGSYLPPVIKKFIKRINDPEQPPLTYKEARDFYSNAGDLSVTQRLKTNRKVGSQLNEFVSNLGDSIQDTANEAGVGQEHAAAMQEWAKAMRLRGVKESVIQQILKPAVKAIPYGAGMAAGGAIGYGAYKAIK